MTFETRPLMEMTGAQPKVYSNESIEQHRARRAREMGTGRGLDKFRAAVSAEDLALHAKCAAETSAFLARLDRLDKARPKHVNDDAWARAVRFISRDVPPGTRVQFKKLPGGEVSAQIFRKPVWYVSENGGVITEGDYKL